MRFAGSGLHVSVRRPSSGGFRSLVLRLIVRHKGGTDWKHNAHHSCALPAPFVRQARRTHFSALALWNLQPAGLLCIRRKGGDNRLVG